MSTIVVAASEHALIESTDETIKDFRFLGTCLLDMFDSIELAKAYVTASRQVHVELEDLIAHTNLVNASYIFMFYELEWFAMRYEDNFVETKVLKTLADNGWNWNK